MNHQAYGVDLHIHTTCSDGTRTVEETVLDAKEAGLAHIAITDHNQFAIIEPMMLQELEIIPGAEFSTAYETEEGRLVEVHVIGLFFDGVPKELHQIFRKIPRQRKHYLDAIITKLNHLGIKLSYEELLNAFPDSNQIGRRHIAELLVKKKYADNITDAFDRLIGNRSPYWVDATKYMKYMPMEIAVKKICENGGFPILAHPFHYHCMEKEVLTLVENFKKAAENYPAGIEVYYSKYDTQRRRELLEIAKSFQLYPSAASDRHAQQDRFEKGDEKLLEAMKQACRSRRISDDTVTGLEGTKEKVNL